MPHLILRKYCTKASLLQAMREIAALEVQQASRYHESGPRSLSTLILSAPVPLSLPTTSLPTATTTFLYFQFIWACPCFLHLTGFPPPDETHGLPGGMTLLTCWSAARFLQASSSCLARNAFSSWEACLRWTRVLPCDQVRTGWSALSQIDM